MHHGTCITHVPWCMPGSVTSAFLWSRWLGKRSRIPGTCTIRNFTYLVRGPWTDLSCYGRGTLFFSGISLFDKCCLACPGNHNPLWTIGSSDMCKQKHQPTRIAHTFAIMQKATSKACYVNERAFCGLMWLLTDLCHYGADSGQGHWQGQDQDTGSQGHDRSRSRDKARRATETLYTTL